MAKLAHPFIFSWHSATKTGYAAVYLGGFVISKPGASSASPPFFSKRAGILRAYLEGEGRDPQLTASEACSVIAAILASDLPNDLTQGDRDVLLKEGINVNMRSSRRA